MAAITLTSIGGSLRRLAEPIQDAEVDTWWVQRPPWAKYAQIYFVVETLAGTSLQLSLHTVPPLDRDDDHIMLLKEQAALTAITSADTTLVVDLGPGILGIADDATTAAGADSYASIACLLPDILGVRITSVGVGAKTYDLSVDFRA